MGTDAQNSPPAPVESLGFFGRIWAGAKAAVCAVPKILMWFAGMQVASSAVAYFNGGKGDLFGADAAYNKPGGLLHSAGTSVLIGGALTGIIGSCTACNTPEPANPNSQLPNQSNPNSNRNQNTTAQL